MKDPQWSEAEVTSFEGNEGALFKAIFNHADIGVVLTDPHGRQLLANPYFLKLEQQSGHKVGFSELIGSRPIVLPVEGSFHHSWPGPLKITSLKLTDQHNEATYLWLVCHNVASRTTDRIQGLMGVYKSFITTTFELVLRTSLDGRILFANRAFLDHFAVTSYRKAKKNNVELFFDNPSHYHNLRTRIVLKRQIISEKVVFRRADGTRLTTLVNCVLQNDKTGGSVINWTLLDISQQTESEEALKTKNDQLEKVNFQMEKFLYSTSHDLRGPLTSILGLVNLMRMEAKEPSFLDYVTKVELCALKLDRIIKDIMNFSRSTYQRKRCEQIDFEALVWKSLETYRMNPSLQKINFEVRTNGDSPFYSDPDRLEIITTNLLRNSIAYYDVNKARPFINVNITITNDHAVLDLMDNGIGIAQQHLGQIFNMFYKASQHSKGAGLGLFIVKETLEKLNGSVTVESEFGFGTIMHITIPNDHKSANRELPPPNSPW